MKKIITLCLSVLVASCALNEDLQDRSSEDGKLLSEELEKATNGYELALKGYSLDELRAEKDESTPSSQKETNAEAWIIKAIQDSVAKIRFTENNRTRTDASAYAPRALRMEGVFKYETCGNYREFVYHMDCEDGGGTNSSGNIGATTVDGNGNVDFHFCVIPGSSNSQYNGTLVFYQPSLMVGGVSVVKRHHDNEDHGIENNVIDNAGLTSFGPNGFYDNTDFFWCVSNTNAFPQLPFRYGLLGNAPLVVTNRNILWIDDENKKNANQAIAWDSFHNPQGYDLPADQPFHGITPGGNTTYEIIIH